VVAVRDQALIGHTGIRVHHPGARICETGNTVVDPAARGQGLLKRLGAALRERVLREGYSGYVHYPTTAHEIMQRASVTGGGTETGIMLAYIAETTAYEAFQQRPGRLAATVAFQPYSTLPTRRVWIPHRYEGLLRSLYRQAGLDRQLEVGGPVEPSAGPTRMDSAIHSDRGVLSLYLERGGRDLKAQAAGLIAAHSPVITHVDVPLAEPALESSVTALCDLGFIFCGLLPEFAEGDVLRLQHLHNPTREDFYPDLVNPGALELGRLMRAEAAVD
jgi:serine/threonine-protein kinase RsbW